MMKFILFIFLFVQLYSLDNISDISSNQLSRDIVSGYFKSAFMVNIDRPYKVVKNGNSVVKYATLCRGTLISPKQVITTADCLSPSSSTYKTPYRNVTIYHDKTRYLVNNIYKHTDFNKLTYINNIAILELDEAINLPQYPSLITKDFLDNLIDSDTYAHILFQNNSIAFFQSVKPVSKKECARQFNSNIDDTLICISPYLKTVTVCPSFQGTPITAVSDDGEIYLVGIVPGVLKNECQDSHYFLATNVSNLQNFLDLVNEKSYISEGPLTRGFIKTLPQGWHFLGTEESIDNSLLYIIDYAKKIYLYVNESNTYHHWTKTNGKWDKDIFIPARSGFWLKR